MQGESILYYRILEKLGAGRMGVVYKAEDTRLGRMVALKLLIRDVPERDEAVRRFLREAQAASSLDHPHIATIYGIDETPDGQMFISMAYYEGETLAERLAREGTLPLDDALTIATQVASGLAEVHDLGIIHRDINPANLMLTTKGVTKILDFGLAKLLDGSQLTRTGYMLGTIAYMPPEQIEGQRIDARADLWALGVVIYEMLSGKRPFERSSYAGTLMSIMERDLTPIRELRPDLPEGVAAFIDKSLQKDASARYPSAVEMLHDLTRLREAPTTVSARSPDRPSESGLHLNLLGFPEVTSGAKTLEFRTRKTLALLVYLTMEGGTHSREKLTALFWPESDEEQARASLRNTLRYLKLTLGEVGADAIQADRNTLSLPDSAPIRVDAKELQLAASLENLELSPEGRAERMAALGRIVEGYRGDFLQDFSLPDTPTFDDWLSVQREAAHRHIGVVLDFLTSLYSEAGETEEATETLMRWVRLDPLNEEAQRRLMTLHYRQGNKVAALQVYETLQATLQREFGLNPTPQTVALAERIRGTG